MILDGIKIANEIKKEISQEVSLLTTKPCLVVILIGNDPASMIYVRKKQQSCKEVGIITKEILLPKTVTTSDLQGIIRELNQDSTVNGILVQLPLPEHINKFHIFDAISPEKDVDVFTPYNTGLLVQGRPKFVPCTPQAVREILVRSKIPITGQNVVIINRSLIVGQPLANMLMQNQEFANATVMVCHEYTKNIKHITNQADIIVTAVGQRDKFVLTADMVNPGATVIDVAITRVENKIIGDVDFEEVNKVAGFITTVPGGVGPCTVACLLKNTLLSIKK